MLIQQNYIIKLEAHLTSIPQGTKVVIGIRDLQRFADKLTKIGFSKNAEAGETILPSATFGRFSRFNALGKNIVRKDLPKETAYRMVEWHWKEWRGRGETEEMTDFRDVPYQRYPRDYSSPPSIEMTVATNAYGQSLVVTPLIEYNHENSERLKHNINLFLEIFGECEIFTENLEGIFNTPVRRINWKILPPGKYPWETLKKQLEPVIRQARTGNRPVVENRLETINQYFPEFVAIGQGGFRNYVVFAFPTKHTFVLESPQTNNATYIFGQDWEWLSQMTKAEVLDGSLQKERIVHRKGWHEKLYVLLSNPSLDN